MTAEQMAEIRSNEVVSCIFDCGVWVLLQEQGSKNLPTFSEMIADYSDATKRKAIDTLDKMVENQDFAQTVADLIRQEVNGI